MLAYLLLMTQFPVLMFMSQTTGFTLIDYGAHNNHQQLRLCHIPRETKTNTLNCFTIDVCPQNMVLQEKCLQKVMFIAMG